MLSLSEKSTENFALNIEEIKKQVKDQLEKSNPTEAYLILRDILEYLCMIKKSVILFFN